MPDLRVYVGASNFHQNEHKVARSVASAALQQASVDKLRCYPLLNVVFDHELNHPLAAVLARLHERDAAISAFHRYVDTC